MTTGIENSQVAVLNEAIAKMELEAAVQQKAEEEAARKEADEKAAAAAAAFKAEAELAEKKAKEEAAARKVSISPVQVAACAIFSCVTDVLGTSTGG